jgi:hypothetical protein
VDDPYWAERAFWSKIPQSLTPYRGGVEVEIMTWEEVSVGLVAAKTACMPPQTVSKPVYETAYNVTVKKRLLGRGGYEDLVNLPYSGAVITWTTPLK